MSRFFLNNGTNLIIIEESMAYIPSGIPAGRPKSDINWELFEQLCGLQCTIDEMCAVLKISDETLRRRAREYYEQDFMVLYKRHKDAGCPSLRRMQFSLAKKNTAMAIWLGKQWLGQKDDKNLDRQELGNIVEAVLEIDERNRARNFGRQRMAVEEPVCNQECSGTEDKVCAELGSAGGHVRSTPSENSPEMPSDRHDNGILH